MANTITDEQIRELCRQVYAIHDVIANIALDPLTDAEDRRIARARCAEILNERAAKGTK